MNKSFFQQLVRILISAVALVSLGCTKGNPIISALPSNELSRPPIPDGMISIPPAVVGAPSITLAPYVGTAKVSSFEITGTCPKNTTSVSAAVNESEAIELSCLNGSYSGTLDLINFSDGELTLLVSAVSGSTPTTIIKDTIVPTSPTPGVVITWWIQSSNSPLLNWSPPTDTGSGIEKCQVRIIKQSDSFEVSSWKDLASGNSLAGLTLHDATNYIFEVRAVDKAGNISIASQSSAWLMDTTPPSASPTVDDGIMTFSDSDSPLINWFTSSDSGSGFSNFELAIGTTSGGSDVLGWINVSSLLAQSFNTLSLSGSQKYFTSIRSKDIAGNKSTVTLGDSWYNFGQSKLAIDNTIPLARWASLTALYGHSLAISEDEQTLVIGAPSDDTDSLGGGLSSNAGAVFVYSRSGSAWVFQQKLVATGVNARMPADYFGSSVAISGSTIVVGAPKQDYDADGSIGSLISDTGAVYLYTFSGGTWSPLQKIVASDRRYADGFGEAVAIDGNIVVVGASDQDYDESNTNVRTDAGAAYIFSQLGATWTQSMKLVAFDRQASDYFGRSVAISADTVVVGAPLQDLDSSGAFGVTTNAGAAYVYREGPPGAWSIQQKLVATGFNARNSDDKFGSKVAIDVNTIVVGAPDQDYDSSGNNYLLSGGAVFIYNRSGGVWSQDAKLTTPSARGTADNFGSDLAIDGNTLLIGANGHSTDSSDTNAVSFAGAAYVYSFTANWSLQRKLSATGTNSRNTYDRFASSVALSGSSILIGVPEQDYDSLGNNVVPEAGAAFAFNYSGDWIQTEKITDELIPQSRMDLELDRFGNTLVISEDGNTLIVGAPKDSTNTTGSDFVSRAGAAYIYGRSGSNWILKQKLIPTGINARKEDDGFGSSVGISGNTIAIGAPTQNYDTSGAGYQFNAGAIYIFTLANGTWAQTQKLVPAGINARNTGDNFASNLAISGNTLVAGVPDHDYNTSGTTQMASAGAAFVFTFDGSSWNQTSKLTAEGFTGGRLNGDKFAVSVAISGNHIAVGATGHDYDEGGLNYADGAGAVYTFSFNGSDWLPQQKLVGQGTNGRITLDRFGTAVALNGTSLVVGTIGQDYDSVGDNSITDAGAVYAFEFNGASWISTQKVIATGVNNRFGLDFFGSALAITSNILVVGASDHAYDKTGTNNISKAGAVFVYSRKAGQWEQQLKLTPNGTSSRNKSDSFGFAVTLAEDSPNKTYSIGVGVPDHDFSTSGANPTPDAGAVYLFH